jgi:hypothetical protein
MLRPGRYRYRRSGRDADTSATPQDAWTPSSCPNKDNNTILQFANPGEIYQNTVRLDENFHSTQLVICREILKKPRVNIKKEKYKQYISLL